MASSFDRPLPSKEIQRRDVKYHPSVWGEYFIQFLEAITEPSPSKAERMEKLKKEVKALLNDENTDIGLIDWIQRSGISHHFEKEIVKILEHVNEASTINGDTNCDKYQFSEIHHIGLRFRLLRQRGYDVSADIFVRMKDKKNIENDIRGLLSLYEASYMSVKGEVILDETLEFAEEKLKAALPNLSGSLALQVEYALDLPLQRCSQTLKVRRSIACYESEIGRNEAVVELAKLEFNLRQAIHQKELAELTRWYKNIDVAGKLYFGRDKLVEAYFWALEYIHEPRYSRSRIIAVKVLFILSIVDDLYDVYGTLEELEIFTLAVERWDMQVLEQTPECFKVAFSIIFKILKEVEDSLNRDEFYGIGYLRQTMMLYVKSYFTEAKWSFSQYFPTFEEYMKPAVVSSAYLLLTVAFFTGLDSIVSEQSFEWAVKYPSIVHSASLIARIRNDIIGHKDEEEREQDEVKGVKCYMKEHMCSEEEACRALQAIVDDAWKQINYELLHNSVVPNVILLAVADLARVISVLYKNRDDFTDSRFRTKDIINLLFVQPFTV